jgi:hypothetical protein
MDFFLEIISRIANLGAAMLFIKTTRVTVAPSVFAVDVAAKPPGKTFEIFLAVDAENEPSSLLEALEALGFQKALASAYTHNDGKKVLDLRYRKTGTDIFQGWKDEEKEANLRGIEQVFSQFGMVLKPRVMSLAEAF